MNVIPKTVRIVYYKAECSSCGQEYIWTAANLRAKETKCSKCSRILDTEEWPIDELGCIIIKITEDDITLEEE